MIALDQVSFEELAAIKSRMGLEEFRKQSAQAGKEGGERPRLVAGANLRKRKAKEGSQPLAKRSSKNA